MVKTTSTRAVGVAVVAAVVWWADPIHATQGQEPTDQDRPGAPGFGMLALYKRNGAVQGETFETKAAVDAGDAVYRELKPSLK